MGEGRASSVKERHGELSASMWGSGRESWSDKARSDYGES